MKIRDHVYLQREIIGNYWKILRNFKTSFYQKHLTKKAKTYVEASSVGVNFKFVKIMTIGGRLGPHGGGAVQFVLKKYIELIFNNLPRN